jgi:ABC1 atypical kinase-like domain
VPPVEFKRIEATLKKSFVINKATQVFTSFSEAPLASATIAQVHRGTLKDGTDVVLKTQYDDQEALCRMDLKNLRQLASFLQKNDMSFFDLDAVVTEMEKQIPAEFDFVAESVAMTLIAENMRRAGLHDIVIPRAIPGLVSRQTLVMTYVDGVRADNILAMKLFGIRPERVVRAVGRAIGQQMLVDGLQHADLHLGNLLVDRLGRVALLDFGQTKRIDDDLRLKLCQFYKAMATGHAGYITFAFAALGIELDMPDKPDPSLLAMIPLYANGLLDTQPLPADVDISPFSSRSPLQQLPIRKFPSDLLMVLRTVGALRALADALAVDDIAMSEVFLPYAKRGARVRVDPAAEARRARRVAEQLTAGVASPLAGPPERRPFASLTPGWWD